MIFLSEKNLSQHLSGNLDRNHIVWKLKTTRKKWWVLLKFDLLIAYSCMMNTIKGIKTLRINYGQPEWKWITVIIQWLSFESVLKTDSFKRKFQGLIFRLDLFERKLCSASIVLKFPIKYRYKRKFLNQIRDMEM